MATKEERQTAAQDAAIQRVGKQALTLTFAFLRVDSLFEKFHEEMAAAGRNNESAEQLIKSALEATKRIETTAHMRAEALFALQLAALYAVVEKWEEWRFADPQVDELLDEPHVRLLEKYRHVVFHADYYDHKDMKALDDGGEVVGWAAKLAAALRDYLRRWHAEPIEHVTEHLNRVGW
jgi:hypothetical protein